MKYATRMVLVPDTPQTLEATSSKVQKQTNKLAKSVRMKNQAKVKKWNLTPSPPGVVPTSSSPVASPQELANSLPPLYQAKAQRLLNEMMNSGFSWTSTKELVLPSTETIDNSNIEAILKEALVRGTSIVKPLGWDAFISEIARSSVPLRLFTKKTTQEALTSQSGGVWEIY